MTKRLLLIGLLFNCLAQVQGQSKLPDSPRYLLPALQGSNSDTSRILLLNKLGSFYLFKAGSVKRDLDSSQFFFNRALSLAQHLHQIRLINETWMLKGNSFLEGDETAKADKCFKNVINYYHQRHDTLNEARAWSRYGDCIPDYNLDKAISCYHQALVLASGRRDERMQVNMLFAMGSCYLWKGRIKEGEACYKLVAAHYHKAGKIRMEANVWLKMGHFYHFGYASKKASCFQNAILLLRRLPVRNRQLETDALKEMADAHLAEGKLDLAEAELKQALADYKALKYKKLQNTYDLLGDVYELKGDPQAELSSYLQSISYMEYSGDTANAQYYYLKIGRAYQFLGFHEKSIYYIDKALFHSTNINASSYAEAAYYKTHLMINEGKPREALLFLENFVKLNPPKHDDERGFIINGFAECYQALGQYNKAEKFFLEMARSVESSKAVEYKSRYANVNYAISNLYVDMKQYDKAAYYLKHIVSGPGILGIDEMGRLQLLHFKIDSAHSRYLTAIRHYQLYGEFKDSIFNATKNKQLQEVETSYETKEKEQAIAGLKTREKIQLSELKKVNTERDFTLVGIAMMFIIAGLAYYGFRQKRRSNLLLQLHQKEIDKTNESLQHLNYEQQLLLIEKEWLLKEIHHRVKNNLQTTISLLNMQSAYLSNDEALTAIRNSQRRMQAMSLIHQKLYQSETMTHVQMADYIAELVAYLKESFHGSKEINFVLHIEPIMLEVTQAIPLGLIINEAVTNAIKYAFPENEKGNISISLKKNIESIFDLVIADNGVGMPRDFEINDKHDSLGLNLIRGLTDQINGELNIINKNGTSLRITFRESGVVSEEEFKSFIKEH